MQWNRLFIFILITTVVSSCKFGGTEESSIGTGLFIDHKEVENKFTLIPPTDGTYETDDILEFKLKHAADLTVLGSPRLDVTIGSNNVYAYYHSGSGSKILTFRYTVLQTDEDLDGIELTGTLDLNAGRVSFNHKDGVADVVPDFDVPSLRDVLVENPPASVTISALQGPINISNNSSYGISGTCSENGRDVDVRVDGGLINPSPVCAVGLWSVNYDASGLADGPSITITADHQNNIGENAPQASVSVIKDTVAPTVTIDPSADITPGNVSSYPLSGNCSSADNGQNVLLDIGGQSETASCSGGTWSFAGDVSGLSDGAVNIAVDLIDLAGNQAVQATDSVLKDTSVPTVTINALNPINIANASSYSADGTCSEDTRDVDLAIGSLNFTVTCSSGTWSQTGIDATSLADSASVSVTADHDNALGTSAVQATATIVKDTVAPVLTINSAQDILPANTNPYLLDGTCLADDNGQDITLNIGSIVATVSCSSGTWNYSGDVSSLPDGTVNITADMNDAVGNSAVQVSDSVNKTSSIPTVTINPPSHINISNVSSYAVDGTCSEDTRDVDVAVGSLNFTVTCSGGTWSQTGIDATSLADAATVTITADHDNSVGTQAVQATVDVIKDTVAPTVTIDAAADITPANVNPYTLSGTCSTVEEGDDVNIVIGALAQTASCLSGVWNYSGDVTSVPDNVSVAITADLTDEAGNLAVQATDDVVKDTSVPTVTINPPSHINISNVSSYSVDGTCSEDTRDVNLAVGSLNFTVTCSSGTWTQGSIDATSLADAVTVTITADHDNEVGTSATQATVDVIKDTIAPTVTIDAAADIDLSNVNPYSLTGTCSADEEGDSVNIDIGGVALSASCLSSVWSFSGDTSSVSDGTGIAVTADLTDEAGNPATQATDSINKDTVAPTVAITSPADNSFINIANDSATFAVSGTCDENGATVVINIDASPAASPVGFNCDGANFSGTIDTTGLSEVAVVMTAELSDGANTGTSGNINLTKDVTAPTLSVDAMANIVAANVASYAVSGSCSENNQAISIDVGGVLDSATCSGSSWSKNMNLSGLADGTSISVNITSADLAGNPSNPASTTVDKDSTVPIVAVTSASDINNSNVTNYSVVGSCTENGMNVSVMVGSIPVTPPCVGGAWTTGNMDVSALADGVVTITADQTDSFGNAAVQASVDVNKNTGVPLVAITNAVDIDSSNVTSYKVEGTCTENGRVVTVAIGSLNYSPNCSSGFWSTGFVDVSSLADGVVAITADHDDGTTSATQATTNVNKDLSVPTVTISSAADINTSNETIYQVTGTCSENGRIVGVNIGSINVQPTCSSGTWNTGQQNVSSLADGNILITADHDDGTTSATQASVTVEKDTAGPTVSNLSVASSLSNSVDIDWDLNDPGGFTIDDYVVQYRVKNTSTWLTFNDGVNTNSYGTVTGLNPSTTYEFRVAVKYDSTEQSGWSNTAEGTTQPDDPIFSPNAAMNVGGATSTSVAAYQDNTNITLNGSPLVTLNKGQTHVFTSAQFDVIDADKPIYTAGRVGSGGNTSKANITWNPSSWAGKSFSFNATRNNPQQLHIYATENADITVKQGSTTLASTSLTAGNGTTLSWSVYGSYQISSTGTILAYHISGNPTTYVDPKPLPPSSNKIIGFPSNSMRLTSDLDGTNYTAIHSNSSSTSNSLGQADSIQINPAQTGSLYQSSSLVVSADKNISGASFADSNGNCASVFLPTNLMKTKYIVNASSDYVAFASLEAGTISVYDSSDNLLETLTLTRSGADPNAPYKARRGTTSAGIRFEATVPVAGWYQPSNDTGAADQDETILYGTND